MLTKNFKQLSKDDVAIAGGKGASLGEMINNNIPVPPGFVVLASTFDQFLVETDIKVEIETAIFEVKHNNINSVEKASLKIRDIIQDSVIPDNIANQIIEDFEKLGAELVAVRSSATAEDSIAASWAGELDSFLNVTKDNLLESVKQCWSSLFTPRAIFYRYEKNLQDQAISVAVVIQKMVQSEVSGITFTVHPVTEDKNQMIIEAGYGLGEAIVGGMITPDAYVVVKTDFSLVDVNISKQEKQIIRTKEGVGEAKVADDDQEKQKLASKQIIELAKICLEVEKHYGFPCDIEWAYKKGKFYILQSRPITTIGLKVKN